MRILLIDVNCKNSSTGKIVYDLYSSIRENGDEAAVCYGRGEKISEPGIYKFGIDVETYFHALMTRITGYTGCFSPFSTHRLIKYIKKFKPDVVHIHELHAYFVNLSPLLNYLKKNNIKTVMTLHCEFAYTGKCGHSVECEKWKTECGNCPHLKDYPSTLFFDHTKSMFLKKKRLFDSFSNLTIVTPSQWLADRCRQSFLGKYPIKVINNGIDTNIFYRRDASLLRKKHNIKEGTKVILAVAPDIMSENKGGKFILQLADKMQNENVRFVLIGADEEVDNSNSNVEILGRIYDKDLLAQYYSLADVFVICSKRENFPTTCIEAQCCGAPICGFDVGGVKETLLDEFKANCVEYGDVEKLLECTLSVLNMNFDNFKISHEALNKLSNDDMINKNLRLYST